MELQRLRLPRTGHCEILTMKSEPATNELLELISESREYLRYFGELGVEVFAVSDSGVDQPSGAPDIGSSIEAKTAAATVKSTSTQAARVQLTNPKAATFAPTPNSQSALFGHLSQPVTPLTNPGESLEDIWRDIGECTRCGLCEGRTQVVNTNGNQKARLMFVGEAPGADEDAQGKPFVGRAGQLLTKIIEAIGLKRQEVLIGNVNRCRPPGNRQPTLEEAAICRPFLFREIAAVQPEVIVVLGNTALRNLLEVREGITRVRGKFQDFRGIKVMPTFHPAYLLRDPSKKRETWEDLKKVREYLDQTAVKDRPS